MNRLKKIGLLLSVAGAILIISGIVLQLIMSQKGYTGNVRTEENEFSGVRELVAISTSLPIKAYYGDTETVRVISTGGVPLVFSLENGLLRVTQDDSFTLSLFSLEQLKAGIEIILPHKLYESIILSSSGGNITAESLNAVTYEVTTKSGDISLGNVDERADIRSESGDIDFILSSLNNDMTVYGGNGDISVTIAENASLYLEFLTSSGHFTSDIFDKEYDYSFGDAAAIYNGGRNLLRINTVGGDLNINKM